MRLERGTWDRPLLAGPCENRGMEGKVFLEKIFFKKNLEGISWQSSGLDFAFQYGGVKVQSLAGELRSHMPWG